MHEPRLTFGYDVSRSAAPKIRLRVQALRLDVSRNDFSSDCATADLNRLYEVGKFLLVPLIVSFGDAW